VNVAWRGVDDDGELADPISMVKGAPTTGPSILTCRSDEAMEAVLGYDARAREFQRAGHARTGLDQTDQQRVNSEASLDGRHAMYALLKELGFGPK